MATKFKVKGTLVYKGEVTSGKNAKGYDWQRQDIRIEIPGENGLNPTVIAAQAMNERVNDLGRIKEGEVISVILSIYAREWNGKWFNNVMAESILAAKDSRMAPKAEPEHQAVSSPEPVGELDPNAHEDLPF